MSSTDGLLSMTHKHKTLTSTSFAQTLTELSEKPQTPRSSLIARFPEAAFADTVPPQFGNGLLKPNFSKPQLQAGSIS